VFLLVGVIFGVAMSGSGTTAQDDYESRIAKLEVKVEEVSRMNQVLMGEREADDLNGRLFPGYDPNGYRFGLSYVIGGTYYVKLQCYWEDQNGKLILSCARIDPSW
jgi:hypothetical protein